MGLLNRSELLKKEALIIKKVELDENTFVCVRQMTGRERDRFEQSLVKETRDKDNNLDYKRSLEDFRAKFVVCTVCDEEGKLLLNADDYILLSQNMSAAKLDKIVTAAQEINKITEKDKEALVKNSEPAQEDNSSLDSVES